MMRRNVIVDDCEVNSSTSGIVITEGVQLRDREQIKYGQKKRRNYHMKTASSTSILPVNGLRVPAQTSLNKFRMLGLILVAHAAPALSPSSTPLNPSFLDQIDYYIRSLDMTSNVHHRNNSRSVIDNARLSLGHVECKRQCCPKGHYEYPLYHEKARYPHSPSNERNNDSSKKEYEKVTSLKLINSIGSSRKQSNVIFNPMTHKRVKTSPSINLKTLSTERLDLDEMKSKWTKMEGKIQFCVKKMLHLERKIQNLSQESSINEKDKNRKVGGVKLGINFKEKHKKYLSISSKEEEERHNGDIEDKRDSIITLQCKKYVRKSLKKLKQTDKMDQVSLRDTINREIVKPRIQTSLIRNSFTNFKKNNKIKIDNSSQQKPVLKFNFGKLSSYSPLSVKNQPKQSSCQIEIQKQRKPTQIESSTSKCRGTVM